MDASPRDSDARERARWRRRWRRMADAAAATIAAWECHRRVLVAVRTAEAEARVALLRQRVHELEREVGRLRRQVVGPRREALRAALIAREFERANQRRLAAATERLLALGALASGPGWAELEARVRRIARRACPALVGRATPGAARLWRQTLAALDALDIARLAALEAEARRRRVRLPARLPALVQRVRRAARLAALGSPPPPTAVPRLAALAAQEARWQRRLAALADEREWWAAALALARSTGDGAY